MQAIRSILVILDPDHAHSLALNRAKLIAGVTDAHLHLLMCDPKHDHSALLSLLLFAALGSVAQSACGGSHAPVVCPGAGL